MAVNHPGLFMLHVTVHFPAFRQQHWPTLCFVLSVNVGLFLLTTAGFAQTQPTPDTTIYMVVEEQPEFPGGFEALKEYMRQTVHYPSEAQKAGVKGRVFVNFIVETDGRLTSVNILKGLGYGCNEEAIRVVKAMPKWAPGSQSGKPLRVKYNLPVLFGVDYPKGKVR